MPVSRAPRRENSDTGMSACPCHTTFLGQSHRWHAPPQTRLKNIVCTVTTITNFPVNLAHFSTPSLNSPKNHLEIRSNDPSLPEGQSSASPRRIRRREIDPE